VDLPERGTLSVMERSLRHGRGALALGVYLLLAVLFFVTDLTILGWVASGAAVLSAADLLWVAQRSEAVHHSERTGHP